MRAHPRPVGDFLVSAMPQLSERLLDFRIQRAWTAVAGPQVARRARPGGVSGGVLTVVVDNSPWLHELTLRADELTAALRAEFGDVRAVRFVLGEVPRSPEASAPDAPRPGVPLTPADRDDIESAAAAIADPMLAAAARRLLTKARRFPPGRGGQ
jgi:hypothetical protein